MKIDISKILQKNHMVDQIAISTNAINSPLLYPEGFW